MGEQLVIPLHCYDGAVAVICLQSIHLSIVAWNASTRSQNVSISCSNGHFCEHCTISLKMNTQLNVCCERRGITHKVSLFISVRNTGRKPCGTST